MDKEDAVNVHSGILLSHLNNEIMSSIATWLDLEIIILNEVSQQKTNTCHMISLICKI